MYASSESIVRLEGGVGRQGNLVFSVELLVPADELLGSGRIVLYCDVCRRWGAPRTPHLCGINWFEHLGALLVALDGEAHP